MTDQTQSHPTSSTVIDARTFWRVLGQRAVGATIVPIVHPMASRWPIPSA